MRDSFSHFHDSDNSGLDQKFSIFLDVTMRGLGFLSSFDFIRNVDRNFSSLIRKITVVAN